MVSLTSLEDSYVSQSSPNSNFGSGVTMHVGANERSLLVFDLSVIPVGANVISADLVLCATSIAAGAEGRTLEANQVNSAWTEAGVTWNNQPGASSGNNTTFTVPTVTGCFSVDVSQPLRSWAMGGPNYGFRIKDQTEATALPVLFATREDAVPGMRPTLNVTFTP